MSALVCALTMVSVVEFSSARCFGATVAKPRADAITIEGAIDGDAVRSVESQFDSNVKLIAIASMDGELASELELGNFIQKKNIAIYVSKFCIAGCAQWIFSSSQNRSIEPNAVVAFQGTATALKVVTSNDADPAVRAFFNDTSEREVKFYSNLGISRDLLERPLAELSPICYSVVYSGHDVKDVTVRTKQIAWTPTTAYMTRVGLLFKGFWPKSGAEYEAAFKADNKFKPDAALIWGEEERSIAQVEQNLAALTRCSATDTGAQPH